MKLRRWGAVAVALVVAGCGSSIGGQALPGSSVADSSAASSRAVSSTRASVLPFPEQSSSVSSPPTTSTTSAAPSTRSSAPATSAPASSATGSTAAPSTTVTWLLPLPKGGPGKVNKFGNVIAAPGQPFAIQWRSTQQVAVDFVVDSIQVDRGCAATAKPKNGHLVVITVRAQLGYSTGADLSNESIGFTDDYWTAFDAKDTAQVDVDTPATEACVPYDKQPPIPDDMEPDTVYTGKVALDVATATGSVVLMNSLDGGWVYRFG